MNNFIPVNLTIQMKSMNSLKDTIIKAHSKRDQ